MAYVNVRDWSVDQVTDWLKGLDSIILQYTTSFLNNGVTGHQLLNLRADDLDNLGVKSLGHQELILESVEHLRHFHFELDKENLQMLALKVSCASNSLYKELLLVDDNCPIVSPQMMSDVHNIIMTIKPLVCWLDRAPFLGDKDYIDCKTQLLDLSFEMATRAHRGKFSEKPVSFIKDICERITKLADHIIQEISDPMVLQPASLDLATLKKKEQELGFFISPNNHAVHQIAEIKYGSPAHGSSKIEEGDEIVQVNYQTVVGWQRKNVMILLQDSPPEIVLTLKKRPRHTKVYGQIYMKPYRLPSKKLDGQTYFRWNDSIPPSRLLPMHSLSPIDIPKLPVVIEPPDVEIELSSSDDSEPPDSPLDGSGRMYPLKPRPILQRRNTITGPIPTSKTPYPYMEKYWQNLKDRAVSTHSSSVNIDDTNFETDSSFIRDKSASCNLGLELSPRPTTVIGIGQSRNKSFKNDFKEKPAKKRVIFQEKKPEDVEKTSNLNEEKSVSVNSLASLNNTSIAFIDEGRDLTDRTSMVTEKDAALADVNIHDIIKKFDEKEIVVKPKIFPRSQIKKPPDVPQKPDQSKKPVVPPRSVTTKVRGRLDKSHSTPAYDLTGDENSPVEKFVVKKVQTEVVEHVTSTVSESEPFSEMKYELGIPIVDAISLPLTQTVPVVEEIKITLTEKTEIKQGIDEDLPPKPPPRTFGVVDFNKPAYPIDSPKPNISEKLKGDLAAKSTVFEYLDTKHTYSTEVTTVSKPPESPALLKESNKLQNKFFEPKTASTPKKSDFGESVPSFEVPKNMSESKISPTNSIVRAMIYSNKNKAGKKKNTITAKRRRVTVNDLNPPDTQGYLYQRLRSKHNQNVHWEKRWFVLLGSCLYGFKTKEDPRAACLIFLSGFTVAVASEVKSRSNAFKVYHTGTVFYFSAEDPETLQSWIETITAATLNNDSLKTADGSLYSETDESDTEKPKKTEPEKNPETIKKFNSLKKLTKKHENAAGGSTSLDRKRFFNKSSSHSKNSLPVPTAQFRSYRKIKTTETPSGSVTTGNFTSHVASFFAHRSEIPQFQQSVQNVSVPNLTVEHLGKGQEKASGKLSKVKPLNYVHASNPSLCNINDFHVPNFPKKTFKQCNENLAGFVTLEELMIKQSEEKKLNPYNMADDVFMNLNLIKPDVVYGEVPIRPKEKVEVEEKPEPTFKKGHTRNASDSQKSSEKQDFGSSCFGKRLGSFKKIHKESDDFENRTSTYPKTAKGFDQKLNRSLPRTHKLSENADVSRYASDRNLASERGYEMIYCPETTTDVQFAQNRNLDDRMYKETPKKGHKIKKQNSFNPSDKKTGKSGPDSAKYTNKVSDSSKVKLKSAIQYTPMCLPLSQDEKSKPKLAFELNLDEKSTKGGKFKQIFGKQSEGKKEKTFLGSPKLHRTIFRKNNSSSELNWPSTSTQAVLPQSSYSVENSPPEPPPVSISPHADYPGLEYPPVFEPETYSLADPQSSLTLLRKQGKSNN
ncbi:uncharacterized protein cnk [Tribolium castaneum]|uniref:Uncharacterized protein n=1 Tax=Tribolium castaneum TaxID=7070 RepID=D6WN87_TRICA|nr:PREDICTED: uncharacterized protein LOC659345 [Tribolium castaneum]EFA03078.1 hypothetical protein TcasGA2_TC010952 [Tribolium castaneum]|eukprot:XP_970755.2 PREDICTED: uncharacterized protein LOC659345 [Tribolium castaneum]